MIRIIIEEFITCPEGGSTKTHKTFDIESSKLEEVLTGGHYCIPTVIGAEILKIPEDLKLEYEERNK